MLTQINGITVGYDDTGAGLPVVLLHAFPLNRQMWAEASRELSADYRIIAPDLRGFGETSGTATATMAAMADDVIGLLDALQIEQAVIGGLSMGGYVALNLVGRYPERCCGLVLADTRAGADSAEGQRNRATLAEKALSEGASSIADQLLPKLLSAGAGQEKPELAAQVRAIIETAAAPAIAAASRAMAGRADSTAILPAISVPAMIIVGSEDSLTPITESIILKDSITNASLAIIPDAGHLSNLEQPEVFNRALGIFLEGL
jgi:pimeloyl-ACP methyl ester carboxylesterase